MPKQSRKSKSTASGPVPYNLRSLPRRVKRGSRKGEFDDIKCPICLDPPHKAILLICSSHGMGCRSYVCDTTYNLSNCFDQMCYSQSVKRPAKRASDGTRPTRFEFPADGKRLSCPLCRGEVTGWVVDERARMSMDAVVRTCTLDSCNIQGDYIDLKDHARVLHNPNDYWEVDDDDSEDDY